MNRLTNKKLVDLKYGEFISISKEEYRKQVHEAPTYKEIYTKLGKLEDLEDEFKCPLEIVLKIMLGKIDTIIVNCGDGGYGSIYTDYVDANVDGLYDDASYLSESSNWVIDTNICPVPIKEYKVNWWLKEDLSE